VLSAGALGYSLYRLRDSLADKTVPLTGMMASLVFAGQMINFPLPGAGVSGHLIGGVLCASILGPWAGCLAMTLVLAVQCVLYADGGFLALGANVLNMGVVSTWGGYAVLMAAQSLFGKTPRGLVFAAMTASWMSVMAAAALFCLELRLSYVSSDFNFSRIFGFMVFFHALIGIGEAAITGSVLRFVLVHRTDLVRTVSAPSASIPTSIGRFVVAGLTVSFVVAAFLAPFASEFPDGLEAVGERTGFSELADPPKVFLLDDYAVPGLPEQWSAASVSLAGILGVAAVMGIAWLTGKAWKLATFSAKATDGR
ncbi:MAG: energy-coupling factor ABC transporter permease, partial [Planctomycetota bacterium]|nr:energy-coupling factor ABC transporter permease [Planctomycetota bacterium]